MWEDGNVENGVDLGLCWGMQRPGADMFSTAIFSPSFSQSLVESLNDQPFDDALMLTIIGFLLGTRLLRGMAEPGLNCDLNDVLSW